MTTRIASQSVCRLADGLPGRSDDHLRTAAHGRRDLGFALLEIGPGTVVEDVEEGLIGRPPEVLWDVGRQADGTKEHEALSLGAGRGDCFREDGRGAGGAIEGHEDHADPPLLRPTVCRARASTEASPVPS